MSPKRTSKVRRVNATLDEDLLTRVDEYAARHREDRSTAIRQLLDLALRHLAEDDAIAAFESGRLTLRELAAALHLSLWGAHDLLAERGVAIAQGTIAETAGDLDAVLAELASARSRS